MGLTPTGDGDVFIGSSIMGGRNLLDTTILSRANCYKAGDNVNIGIVSRD